MVRLYLLPFAPSSIAPVEMRPSRGLDSGSRLRSTLLDPNGGLSVEAL